MNIAVFQPPYPTEGAPAAAEACLDWMRAGLDGLIPGGQDLVLLPQYANTPGLNERRAARQLAETQGADVLHAVAASAKRSKTGQRRTSTTSRGPDCVILVDERTANAAERQLRARTARVTFGPAGACC